MGAFIKMFLMIFLVTTGACSKQAPKKPVEKLRLVIIYPYDANYYCDFDPQDYDLSEENS